MYIVLNVYCIFFSSLPVEAFEKLIARLPTWGHFSNYTWPVLFTTTFYFFTIICLS